MLEYTIKGVALRFFAVTMMIELIFVAGMWMIYGSRHKAFIPVKFSSLYLQAAHHKLLNRKECNRYRLLGGYSQLRRDRIMPGIFGPVQYQANHNSR